MSFPDHANHGCEHSATGVASQNAPTLGDFSDESLATSMSALDISCERASLSASRMAWSNTSSSYSPGEELSSSQRPEGSKRRSLTEMSHSARMTPQSQRERGLGLPWLHAHGLCIVDVQAGDVDEARQFCLIPTPELAEKSHTSPSSPELHSPGSMQRRFVDLVHRASLSPAGSPKKLSQRNSLASQVLETTPDTLSPTSPMHECCQLPETTSQVVDRSPFSQIACGATSRAPLVRRLGENWEKTRGDHTFAASTLPSSAPSVHPKVHHRSFVGDVGSETSCAVFKDSPATQPMAIAGMSAGFSKSTAAEDLENSPPVVEYSTIGNVKALVKKFDVLKHPSSLVEYPRAIGVRTLVQTFDDRKGIENSRTRHGIVTRKPSAHMRRSVSRSPMRRFMASGQAHPTVL